MLLPELIPRRLRVLAVELPELDEGEGAWPKELSLEVLESLRRTTVAVSDVVLFERTAWGHAPSEVAWSTDRQPSESDIDYGRRSREGATAFIRSCGDAAADALFVLSFPMWKDAA